MEVAIGEAAANGKVTDDGNEEEQWSDVFWMLQEGGQGERGAHYALTIASLKRKGEDMQEQIDALRSAEGTLLQAARDEIRSKDPAEPRQKDAKQAKTWGKALVTTVLKQATEAAEEAALAQPPSEPTKLALEAQQQVADTLEAHNKAQAEAQALQMIEAEKQLRLQAQQMEQERAIAEAQALQLAEAQAQAEQMAEMQLALQAQALQQQADQEQLEAAANERTLLRAQGLNSKKLPLRPGVPPCGFFMRKGECKYGKQCKWDHPEVVMNTRGFPIRTGEPPCTFYMRMGHCKFAATCKYDHPEDIAAAKAKMGLGPNDQWGGQDQYAQYNQYGQMQPQAPGLVGQQGYDQSGYDQAGMGMGMESTEQLELLQQQLVAQGYSPAEVAEAVQALMIQQAQQAQALAGEGDMAGAEAGAGDMAGYAEQADGSSVPLAD